jgi:hypothetical protein
VKASPAVRAGALIVGATGLAPPVVSSLAIRAVALEAAIDALLAASGELPGRR